ncbi:MAG TPA: hypothetical protein VGJ84_09485, partial [Polyangiaceae bacterium]
MAAKRPDFPGLEELVPDASLSRSVKVMEFVQFPRGGHGSSMQRFGPHLNGSLLDLELITLANRFD